jgi:predicted nucleotidyltransferase
MNLLAKLEAAGVAHPPSWLNTNLSYLTVMGSMAYGCNEDDSDLDLYGFCVPPKDSVFPHLRGEILGFGTQLKRFEQYQEHHLVDPSARAGKGQEYDVSVYSVVKLFQLAMENNPNIIDSLFTARECVVFSTPIGEMVRERRRLFLHKGCWHKFRGYAYAQIAKLDGKRPEPGSRRAEYIEKYGFDVKYAVHLVRLILECEQALVEGDIDLRRHSDLLRAVRRGEWSKQQVLDWFYDKERVLEPLYHSSKVLPYRPDEDAIKTLLLNCLEHHYGSLGNALVVPGRAEQALKDIQVIIDKAMAR